MNGASVIEEDDDGPVTGETLKAPMPWFGGKQRAAALIWSRLGEVTNYVDPFFGSGAVLLGNPKPAQIETVNDISTYLANFWRSIRYAPALTAYHADQPVNEANLHAMHRWLLNGPAGEQGLRRWIVAALEAQERGEDAGPVLRAALAEDRPLGPAFRDRVRRDPDYFDAEVAGRWVTGLCAWIGSGWCREDGGEGASTQIPDLGGEGAGVGLHSKGMRGETVPQMDHLGNRGMGVHRSSLGEPMPALGGSTFKGQPMPNHGAGLHGKTMAGPSTQLPHLGDAGRGGHRAPLTATPSEQLPHLGGTGMDTASGIHASRLSEQLPRLGGPLPPSPNGGAGIHGPISQTKILATFEALARRLRRVRVACGDFERVLSDSVTWRHGLTGIVLDPPYADGEEVYSAGEDPKGVFARAVRWAEEHGADERLRICVCGYDGTWTPPAGWETVEWRARGGYGSQRKIGAPNENAKRERLWFSPACLKVDATPAQRSLF